MKIKKLAWAKYENVRALFNENDLNLPAAYGVIEGLVPGQIWVDDQDSPLSCLILK